MGLSIAGELEAAERAYAWLAQQQLDDGSWWACYRGGYPDAATERRETNYIAYIATGVWHHFLVTGDLRFLARFFPVVTRAIDFVLRYQGADSVDWAADQNDRALGDARDGLQFDI